MTEKETVFGVGTFISYITSKDISFWDKFFVVSFVLLYIICPIDLIPDTPFLGWIDDIGIGGLFLAYCSHRVKTIEEKKDALSTIIDITPITFDHTEKTVEPTTFHKEDKKHDNFFFKIKK